MAAARGTRALLISVLLLLLTAAAAASSGGRSVAAAPIPRDGPVRVEVVLDVSGSMARPTGDGRTRMQAARDALSELVRSLPRRTELGLRLYGSEYDGNERRVACRDTRLVHPIQRLDPAAIERQVAGLRPTGDTPIGHALRRAASDFPRVDEDTQDVIVLISDGEDTCGDLDPPPCQVVRQLDRDGFEVRIETVGFGVTGNPAARRQLECIADATGGAYYDATDPAGLTAALQRISERSLGVLPAGLPVVGSARERRAPVLESGAYRIEIAPGEVTYFGIDTEPGDHPRVTATIQGDPAFRMPRAHRRCASWRMELRNPQGEGREFAPYGSSTIFDGRGFGPVGVSTAEAVSPASTGIDFPGRWTLQISLGLDNEEQVLECAEHLPRQPFEARFAIDLGREGEGRETEPEPTASASPSESPESSPSPSPSSTPTGVPPAEKYDLPADPEEAPSRGSVVVPVLAVIGAMGAAAFVWRARQRRLRGW